MIGWVCFAAGGLLCVLNAYLSWLRYPLYLVRGGLPDDYRWVSGVPLFGSLLVAFAWSALVRQEGSILLNVLAWTLIAIDTGGLHWFFLSVTYHWFRGHGKNDA